MIIRFDFLFEFPLALAFRCMVQSHSTGKPYMQYNYERLLFISVNIYIYYIIISKSTTIILKVIVRVLFMKQNLCKLP